MPSRPASCALIARPARRRRRCRNPPRCSTPPQARARDLGIPFDGTPGPLNAITDVAGVLVGHTTLDLRLGQAESRPGTGAHRRHGHSAAGSRLDPDPVFAAWFAQNGNGEMTGTTWIEESGFLEGPVMITNTHSVGVVRDAVIQWRVAHGTAEAGRRLVVAAGGRRDLGRLAERHQRLSRQARACLSRARRRARRRRRGRQRRRRHRHDLQRLQGRHRHRLASAGCARTGATRSASWCSATTAPATTCASRASTWAARFLRPSLMCSSLRISGSSAPSSSWSRPTRRCSRIS